MHDQQLAADFWLHEFPGWQSATAADVVRLRATCARVLQPIRNQFGKVTPTSWMRWSNGTERDGSHSAGGTVDFTVPGAPSLYAVFEWGSTYLLPTGFIGRWIYEPLTASQGEHIHMSPRADMIEVFGKSDIQALREEADGTSYVMAMYDTTAGTFLDPYTLDPLIITAGAGWSPWWLLALAGLFLLDISGQGAGGIKLGRA